MEKSILIGGEAGQGVKKTSYLIGKAFADAGFYVFNYQDYPSLIRGGHNFCVLKVSNKPVASHARKYDFILALDAQTIQKHRRGLKKNGLIIADKEIEGEKNLDVDLGAVMEEFQIGRAIANDLLAGVLFKLLGFSKERAVATFQKEFPKKSQEVEQVISRGYELPIDSELIGDNLVSDEGAGAKYFLDGNQAIGAGAIYAGLDTYIAYPMTPATGVLSYLAGRQQENNILVLQLENEIAVANAALAASYAGAISMVGSSGGGIALMGEALSMAGMAELPLVVYLSQRSGPASGIPTYTSQGDLKFALNIGHGEFPRIVMAPGDARESFYQTVQAIYLSQKYRLPAILIGDKHVGESYYCVDEFQDAKIEVNRNIVEDPEEGFENYAINERGYSPRSVPGQVKVSKATSYEHDEFGNTTEEEEWSVKMNDKRWRKMISVKEEVFSKLDPIKVYGEGENLLIGWGSTKGAISDALKKLDNYRFLQIRYISPFPSNQVLEEINNSKNVVLVENNATGLLGQVIREQTGYQIEKKILKYDGRPFVPKDIVEKIKDFEI